MVGKGPQHCSQLASQGEQVEEADKYWVSGQWRALSQRGALSREFAQREQEVESGQEWH